MPLVDKNAPQVTNSDAAMWRRDHASAIRYIEALLAENTRLREALEEAVDEASDGIVDPSIISCWRDALEEGNADET